MDGPHSAEDAEKVCEKVLADVYKKLSDHHVLLEGTLLKPNMVRSGESAATKCDMTEVAVRTVRCLSRARCRRRSPASRSCRVVCPRRTRRWLSRP